MTFVVFEGGEASGKTTQAGLLAARLDAVLAGDAVRAGDIVRAGEVVLTREPGGTDVGERIRSLLLDPGGGSLSPRTEALLMAAARAQHVDEVIKPALDAGRVVVCDRFSGSSFAYQGYGRGLPLGELRCLSGWAAAGVEPDLVILLDVSESVAEARTAGRSPGRSPDRLESAGDDFHRRVREGFRALAAADPDRWVVIDGSGSVEEVAARVLAAYEERSGRTGG